MNGCGKKVEDKKGKESQAEVNKIVAADALKELKGEYGEEFELESIKYIVENDSYIMFVHSRGYPETSFRVIKWSMAGRVNIDNYIPIRRADQTTKIFQKFADSIDERNLFYANIISKERSGFWLSEQPPFWQMEYSVEDLIEMYNENLNLDVYMFFFFDFTKDNSERIYKELYKMLEYTDSLGIAQVCFTVEFFDENYFKDKDVKWILKEKMGPAGMMNFDSHYSAEYNLTTIWMLDYLMSDLMNEVKSYKDIENYTYYKKFNGKILGSGMKDYDWVEISEKDKGGN